MFKFEVVKRIGECEWESITKKRHDKTFTNIKENIKSLNSGIMFRLQKKVVIRKMYFKKDFDVISK